MADITLTYKGAQIAETSVSGTKTLKTAGKYCEDDIVLNYVRPSGGASASIVVTSEAGATLTCGSQTYQLGASETTHTFTVALGTYTVTATKGTFTKSATVVADVADASYPVSLTNSRLPSGYTELTYIESTGTQYIDTGVSGTVNTAKVECDFEYTAAYGEYSAILGTPQLMSLAAWNNSSAYSYVFTTSSSQLASIPGIAINNRYLLTLEYTGTKSIASIAGVTRQYTQSGTKTLNDTLYLFATHRSEMSYSKAKMYSCKITINGTLARDFVPCVRMSDGEVGMYDLVTESFFGNIGTGVFVGGGVA